MPPVDANLGRVARLAVAGIVAAPPTRVCADAADAQQRIPQALTQRPALLLLALLLALPALLLLLALLAIPARQAVTDRLK
jgi:hypothetical protein